MPRGRVQDASRFSVLTVALRLLSLGALSACGVSSVTGGPEVRPPADGSRPSASPERTNPRLVLGRARVVLERGSRVPISVDVDVAATEPLRRRGLMFRRSMPRDEGMLFVFDEPEVQHFWMRNTYLRLDMIFIDAEHQIVGIVQDATPLTETERAVDAESLYVLEVHGGFAARHAIMPGNSVRFEGLGERR